MFSVLCVHDHQQEETDLIGNIYMELISETYILYTITLNLGSADMLYEQPRLCLCSQK